MTDTERMPPILGGLSDVADRYDGYLIDLWGTLHNGVEAFPHAVDCLHRLRERGKRVCLLSNGPRRLASIIARLDEMHVPRDVYDHVMSSGEATHLAIRDRADPWHAALGRRCFHLGPPRDADVHQNAGVETVADVREADFILCTGIDGWDETVETYEDILAAGAERGLPMVCANPDLVVVHGDRMSICAGSLAHRYEQLGGDVFYHGKPYRPVYDRCVELLGVTEPTRILGIGDSLRTDVAGANAAGMHSLLLVDGIHAEDFRRSPGGPIDPDRIAAAIGDHGHVPTYVAERLSW